MHKAFQYRAYLTREQEDSLCKLLETHRQLYNSALEHRRVVYKTHGRSVTYLEQQKMLTAARKNMPDLAGANCASCQRTLKRLDRACTAFFRRVKAGQNPGYPRFRGIGRFDSIEFTYNNGCCISNHLVYFQGVGHVKLKLHREIEGTIKSATIRRHAGEWYVSFTCVLPDEVIEPSSNPLVGFDLGLKSFLVTSEGESVAPPQFYRRAERKLTRAQKQVSRKRTGSANRKKAVLRLARAHAHVANQRKDFRHKTALDLVRRYGKIAHEALNIQGICRSRLAKAAHDVGWAGFLTVLKHKAESAGVEVVAVDARYTTQTCSACGKLPATSIGLKVREYICAHCGHTADRDHNAAVNIRKRAFSK